MAEKKISQENDKVSGSRLNLNVLLKRLKHQENIEKKHKFLAVTSVIFIMVILALFLF